MSETCITLPSAIFYRTWRLVNLHLRIEARIRPVPRKPSLELHGKYPKPILPPILQFTVSTQGVNSRGEARGLPFLKPFCAGMRPSKGVAQKGRIPNVLIYLIFLGESAWGKQLWKTMGPAEARLLRVKYLQSTRCDCPVAGRSGQREPQEQNENYCRRQG